MDEHVYSLIINEIRGCFDFFWRESNIDKLGYGLTKDKTSSAVSSIASIGFAFASYVIGVERKYISFDKGYDRCNKTLDTLMKIKTYHGFFPHFIDPYTPDNFRSEYSTIDTTILLCGGIVAATYFKGEVEVKVNKLLYDCDWNHFMEVRNGNLQINMAYSEYIWKETNGFCPATWDQYAEQLMMYLIIAGRSDIDKETALKLYNGFIRHENTYHGKSVVHCYSNALFTHQFSHAFFPFQSYLDGNGFDWFKNSVSATLCNREYCMSKQKKFKTYHKNSWGLTAFLGEKRYEVFGAPPYGLPNIKYHQKIDGSVAPYASLCSINFIPKYSIEALKYMDTIKGLKGVYGYTDSYNLDTGYISDTYIGIDKGPTIVMLENYLTGTIWKYFTDSEIIKQAINKLNFKEKEKNNEKKN